MKDLGIKALHTQNTKEHNQTRCSGLWQAEAGPELCRLPVAMSLAVFILHDTGVGNWLLGPLAAPQAV